MDVSRKFSDVIVVHHRRRHAALGGDDAGRRRRHDAVTMVTGKVAVIVTADVDMVLPERCVDRSDLKLVCHRNCGCGKTIVRRRYGGRAADIGRRRSRRRRRRLADAAAKGEGRAGIDCGQTG